MPDNAALVQEKLDQAVAVLNKLGVDSWMTFVRETSLTPDPALDLILGLDMVWQSAFIVTRDNRRIAIVGLHDAENVRMTDGYTEIVTYVQGIRSELVRVLLELNPAQIALNYSESDVAADGLAHGLMLLLQRYLTDTDLPSRFISSEKIIEVVRGHKSPAEVQRIKAAITGTQDIFRKIGQSLKPGVSELDVARKAHEMLDARHLTTAWEREYCPTVDAGPESPVGHAGPQAKYIIQPGMIVHMDFGIKQNDYCADLQRVWYIRKKGEKAAPEPVRKAFEAARAALMAGFAVLRPGAEGWQVDEAARSTLVAAGYPEYQHAFGHHLGRAAHDGATVLGPRWERYGQTPFGVVDAGNVFAIELGVAVDGYGYIGLEENVQVTQEEAQFLSNPQTEIWLV